MASPNDGKSQQKAPNPPLTIALSEKAKARWAALAADKDALAKMERQAEESTHIEPTVREYMNVRDRDESQQKGLTVQQQFMKDQEFLYGDHVLEKHRIKLDKKGESSEDKEDKEKGKEA